MADNAAMLALSNSIAAATQALTSTTDVRERVRLTGQLMQATTDLQMLIQGPEQFLKTLSLSYHDITALSVVTEFNLAPLVPLDASISFEELASKSGAPAARLERVLRLLFTRRIFRESTPGQVAHTPVSHCLATNTGLAAYLGHCTNEVFPSSARLAQALSQPETPSQTAFNLAFNTMDPFFTYMEKHPPRFERFNMGMTGVSKGGGRSIQAMVDVYPWHGLGKAVVADVGGGQGHVSQALAQAYPELSFVVQDYAVAVEAGAKANTEPRVTFEAHDMFTEQSSRYDVCYLRHILHDWPDEYCIKILRAQVSGLRSGGRVLVSELVVQPQLQGPQERFARCIDIQMMVLLNARERTTEDFEHLFAQADARYKLVKVWTNETDPMADSLIEVVHD